MKSNNRTITFEELDKLKGIPDPPPLTGEEFPLPAWYRSIRKVPLMQLTVGDIARACQQEIHLDEVVPIVVYLLGANILEGEMYEGELLFSLSGISNRFWKQFPDLAAQVRQLLSESKNLHGDAEKYRQTILSHLPQE